MQNLRRRRLIDRVVVARKLAWRPAPAVSVALPDIVSIARPLGPFDPKTTESMRTLSVAPAASPGAMCAAKAWASWPGKACQNPVSDRIAALRKQRLGVDQQSP